MAGVMAVTRGAVETVDVLKVGSGGVEAMLVDDQMPIVANPDDFARQANEPFDIELVRGKAGDGAGFKHHNFTAPERAEIVGEPVDEQMIAAGDFDFEDGFAGLENPADLGGQDFFEVIGRKPDGVPAPALEKFLDLYEWKEGPGRFYFLDLPCPLGGFLIVGDAMNPIIEESPAPAGNGDLR